MNATRPASRVFGYARVSTDDQANDGSSLDTQQQQIIGYAMMKGWQVAEHFVERGVSGSIPLIDRPEGKRLLTTVGKGDVIITAKLDRAFRSALDALEVLEELKERGIGLHMIDLGGDVTGNGSVQNGFHHSRSCRRRRARSYPRTHPRRQTTSSSARHLERWQPAIWI